MKNLPMNITQWALLLILATLWGTSFIFNEIVLTEMQPITAAHIALTAGAIIIILYGPGNTLFTTKLPWINFIIMGILNTALPFSLIINAQIHITAATAAILVAITPFSTIILAHIFLKEEPMTLKKIIGMICAIGGLTFILDINPFNSDPLNANSQNLTAKIMIISATFCYATATIFAKLKFENIPFTTAAAGQLISAAIILLPVAILTEKPWNISLPSINVVIALFGIAALGTALAYTIYFKLIQSAGASNVSLVAIFIPLATLFFDWIILNEKITQNHIIGLILIIVGIIVIDGRLIQKIYPQKMQHNTKK